MSTRSLIGVELPETKDGRPGAKVRAAYCHWDGYPDHNGRILIESFNSLQGALAVVACGYISALRRDLAECLSESYNREPPMDFYTVELFAEGDMDAEYCYLFRNGGWEVFHHTAWLPVADCISKEDA